MGGVLFNYFFHLIVEIHHLFSPDEIDFKSGTGGGMKMDEIVFRKIENDQVVLKIMYDDSPDNPREIGENLGTMVYWHRRYTLGDEQAKNVENYSSWEEWLRGEIGTDKDILYLPLYLYDHSGITMRTKPFNDPWDSGQVGWIYVRKEKVREWFGVKRVTPKIRERALEVLELEVRMFDAYISNEIYGFVIEDKEGNIIDSCWGFYGCDWKENGLMDYISCEYHDLAERLVG